MSENTFPHYRTGTFPVTVTGFDAPCVAEARWVRDHHVVHLFLPAIQGTATAAVVLDALPAAIRPSRPEVFHIPVKAGDTAAMGVMTWDAGATAVAAHATVARTALAGPVTIGPCAVHYLSIPGQVQDAAGVMQFLAEGATPHAVETPEDEAGQTAEGGAGDAGVQGEEPDVGLGPAGDQSETGRRDRPEGLGPGETPSGTPAPTPDPETDPTV